MGMTMLSYLSGACGKNGELPMIEGPSLENKTSERGNSRYQSQLRQKNDQAGTDDAVAEESTIEEPEQVAFSDACKELTDSDTSESVQIIEFSGYDTLIPGNIKIGLNGDADPAALFTNIEVDSKVLISVTGNANIVLDETHFDQIDSLCLHVSGNGQLSLADTMSVGKIHYFGAGNGSANIMAVVANIEGKVTGKHELTIPSATPDFCEAGVALETSGKAKHDCQVEEQPDPGEDLAMN